MNDVCLVKTQLVVTKTTKVQYTETYAILVFEAFKDALQEHPTGPKELQSKVQGQIQGNDNEPHHKELQISGSPENKGYNLIPTFFLIKVNF